MSDDKADNVLTPAELIAYYRGCNRYKKLLPPWGIKRAVETIENEWNRCLREHGPVDAVAKFSVTLHQLQREINGGGEG